MSLPLGSFEVIIFFVLLVLCVFAANPFSIAKPKTNLNKNKNKQCIKNQIRSVLDYHLNSLVFNMGEAKRRKDLGLPPREKEFVLPEFNKDKVKQKVRNTLYKYPIIPFVFYGVAIVILFVGVFSVIKYYK